VRRGGSRSRYSKSPSESAGRWDWSIAPRHIEVTRKEEGAMRYLLLWLLGVPLSVIALLWLFGIF